VIVSLWLARQSGRIRLDVSVYPVLQLTPGHRRVDEYVLFLVTNTGLRTAHLKHIGWRSEIFRKGPFKQVHGTQMPDLHPSNSPLPCQLSDGQEARYLIPITAGTNLFTYFKPEFAPNLIYRWTVRAVATTTSGQEFRVRPSKSFFEKMDALTTPSA
jgi:hypothetical protein